MFKNILKILQYSVFADVQTKRAFTLAEVLITLGIIGVVAAIIIPTLIADYQKRTYDTAATTFERKLGEVLKTMNTQSSLAGFDSTEDFVGELSKHFKINKVCQNDKLMECFEKDVFWGAGTATPETVDMTKVKKAKHLGQTEWQQTNVVGVQFASGVTALIAYNKDASQDPLSNQIVTITGSTNEKSGTINLGTDALAILYDTNGAKSPNQSNKDLRSINVTSLGKKCFVEINGVCLARAPFVPTPVTKEECEQLKADDYGINTCYHKSDYWAGAVKACGGTSKMASLAQLGEIANYLYKKNGNGIILDPTKVAELGLPTSNFYLWSGEEYSGSHAYYYYITSVYKDERKNSRNISTLLTVCLGD